jgi:uncharacterized protein GlcG (DUF336 family)
MAAFLETLNLTFARRRLVAALVLFLVSDHAVLAQPQAVVAARPKLAPSISLAEARTIIDGAQAFARSVNRLAAVAVVDTAGHLISLDAMDGVRPNDIRGAQGKAFASAIFRDTTQDLGEVYKTRPDRFFGILNMYPGQVYLVGGGVPLAVDGKLVGAVGVAGLPEFVDEKAARAGMAAWEKMRATAAK